jgi:molybdopterin molybdotransferase
MPVQIHIPKFFKKYAGDHQDFNVHAPTMAAVFQQLCQTYPDLRERLLTKNNTIHPYLALFLNGHSSSRDQLEQTPTKDGDQIEVIAMAVGGSTPPIKKNHHDVRMKGFAKRLPVDQACQLAYGGTLALPSELVHVTDAANRVLAKDIQSTVNVPNFRRSAMDGYAIQAEDSFSASLYDPIPLQIIGEILPGASFTQSVQKGQAVRIMTGAPVPDGADAVIKAEETQEAPDQTVLIQGALSPGKNVGRVGEDIEVGQELLKRGRRLRPQDLGVLASIGHGHGQIDVIRKPRIRLIATGNELLPPGEQPRDSKIIDSNTPMLQALIQRDGATLESINRLPDDKDTIRNSLLLTGADVLIATGGTSVGCEDFLPILVQEHGELLVHGVAIRPSAPTGIGLIHHDQYKTPIFLLPGNPVSCLCAYDFFAAPLIRKLGGLPETWPHRTATLPLKRRISSQIGRVDYVRVAVENDEVTPIAISGASVLSSTTRATGFVITPEGSEGMAQGTLVQVYFYDQ